VGKQAIGFGMLIYNIFLSIFCLRDYPKASVPSAFLHGRCVLPMGRDPNLHDDGRGVRSRWACWCTFRWPWASCTG
jgi:hypothetical protein